MVTDGVSKLGYNGLIFVDPRLKVDGNYYRNLLLHNGCCLPYPKSLASSYFSKTGLQRTRHASFQTLLFYKVITATRLKCGGIFNERYIANFLLSVLVKEI